MAHSAQDAGTGVAPSSKSSKGGSPAPTLPLLATIQEYNRKNRRPSEAMTESDGFHYRCSWIENSITVHSDGNVSCGLDDPHGQRSFGNVKKNSVEEIFGNPEYRRLQDRLWNGHRCIGCGLYRRADDDEPPPETRPRLPKALVVETTVKCNLRCPNTACIPNNDASLKTRDSESLEMETLKLVTDQLSTSLETIHFYNYGEPFLNRQAEDMMLYLREKCPGALMGTSTNAILLSDPSRAEKVVLAAPDKVIVSISGVTQEVYGRYHAAGKCERALAGLKNICDAKRRLGRTLPAVIVRYLVFHWNDRDEQIDGVIALAKEYGVDRFLLHLTDLPAGARSVRFSPGSPSWFKYQNYIRFDHAGRLDHLYNCELPDEDGLFRPEEMPDLGPVRRTGSEATLRRNGRNGRLRLSIATDRPLSRERTLSCLVRTPWRTVEVPLTFGIWRHVSIRVPRRFRGLGPLEIKVTTDDYWFPAEEYANSDLRCLGVLIRSEALIESQSSRPRRRLVLRTLASLRRFWRRRLSPTLLGRTLSSWDSALDDLSGRPRPDDGGQAPPRIDEDPARDAEAERHEQSIHRLYRTILGRSPDPEGLRGWMQVLMSGSCMPIQVAQDFVASAEFRDLYGADPTPADFVAAACRNALGHEPDPADCRRWVDFLTEHGNGKSARAATAIGIMNSMASIDGSAGATATLSEVPHLPFRGRSLMRSAS